MKSLKELIFNATDSAIEDQIEDIDTCGKEFPPGQSPVLSFHADYNVPNWPRSVGFAGNLDMSFCATHYRNLPHSNIAIIRWVQLGHATGHLLLRDKNKEREKETVLLAKQLFKRTMNDMIDDITKNIPLSIHDDAGGDGFFTFQNNVGKDEKPEWDINGNGCDLIEDLSEDVILDGEKRKMNMSIRGKLCRIDMFHERDYEQNIEKDINPILEPYSIHSNFDEKTDPEP